MGRFTNMSTYVKAKLNTQMAQRAQRSESSNKEDPKWNDLAWRFNVEPDDQFLEFSVYSEGLMSDDQLIGSLQIPVAQLFGSLAAYEETPISDKLRDLKTGEELQAQLEVHLQHVPN